MNNKKNNKYINNKNIAIINSVKYAIFNRTVYWIKMFNTLNYIFLRVFTDSKIPFLINQPKKFNI